MQYPKENSMIKQQSFLLSMFSEAYIYNFSSSMRQTQKTIFQTIQIYSILNMSTISKDFLELTIFCLFQSQNLNICLQYMSLLRGKKLEVSVSFFKPLLDNLSPCNYPKLKANKKKRTGYCRRKIIFLEADILRLEKNKINIFHI